MPSRENGGKAWLRRAAVQFLRSGLNPGIAELRPFPAILRGMQPIFSASQTDWRRGLDSNPRYRSETGKSRHLRKLHGINQFRNSLVTGRSPVDTLNDAVCRPFGGECLGILWLKVVFTTLLKRPNWFARDCAPAAQSESEKYLRRMCSSKGERPAILIDSCACFVTRLRPIDRETL